MIKFILYLTIVLFLTLAFSKGLDKIIIYFEKKHRDFIRNYFDLKFSANSKVKDKTKDVQIGYYNLSHNKKRTFYRFLYLMYFNKLGTFMTLFFIGAIILILYVFMG